MFTSAHQLFQQESSFLQALAAVVIFFIFCFGNAISAVVSSLSLPVSTWIGKVKQDKPVGYFSGVAGSPVLEFAGGASARSSYISRRDSRALSIFA